MSKVVYIASSNASKLRELEVAGRDLPAVDLNVKPLLGLGDISAPVENGTTFEENAALKAQYYSDSTPECVIADDSGLEVDALSGGPGIYSARFAGPQATDKANNELLLRRLMRVEVRSARFTCVLTLAKAGEVLRTFRASVEGEILTAPQGANGFGYDPLFFYPPLGRSFGELTFEEKLGVSHRGQAGRQLFAYLVAWL